MSSWRPRTSSTAIAAVIAARRVPPERITAAAARQAFMPANDETPLRTFGKNCNRTFYQPAAMVAGRRTCVVCPLQPWCMVPGADVSGYQHAHCESVSRCTIKHADFMYSCKLRLVNFILLFGFICGQSVLPQLHCESSSGCSAFRTRGVFRPQVPILHRRLKIYIQTWRDWALRLESKRGC